MRRTRLTHRRAHPPLTNLSARKQKMTNFNTVSSVILLSAVTALAGCTHPLQTLDTEALRHRLLSTYQLHVEAVSAGAVIEVSRPPSEVASELSKERREELDAMSGGESYKTAKLEIGETLLGTDEIDTVHISLKTAFELAIRNNLDIQEFMIVPVGADTVAGAIRAGAEIFQTLKKALSDSGHGTNVGDEGGFAPNLSSNAEALAVIKQAVSDAGYTLGKDVTLALDCASSEFFKDGTYDLAGEGKQYDAAGFTDYLARRRRFRVHDDDPAECDDRQVDTRVSVCSFRELRSVRVCQLSGLSLWRTPGAR